MTFATLFAFVGLSISDAFKGIEFKDDLALANALFYFSFITLTSTGYGDIVPVHPLARSLCNLEMHHRPAISGNDPGQARDARIEGTYDVAAHYA